MPMKIICSDMSGGGGREPAEMDGSKQIGPRVYFLGIEPVTEKTKRNRRYKRHSSRVNGKEVVSRADRTFQACWRQPRPTSARFDNFSDWSMHVFLSRSDRPSPITLPDGGCNFASLIKWAEIKAALSC